MTKTNEKTTSPRASLISLGAFTIETKGPATQHMSDGVQGQWRLTPGLAAD